RARTTAPPAANPEPRARPTRPARRRSVNLNHAPRIRTATAGRVPRRRPHRTGLLARHERRLPLRRLPDDRPPAGGPDGRARMAAGARRAAVVPAGRGPAAGDPQP